MTYIYFLVLAFCVGICHGMDEQGAHASVNTFSSRVLVQLCDINMEVPYDCTFPAWQLLLVNKELTEKVLSLQRPILKAMLQEFDRTVDYKDWKDRDYKELPSLMLRLPKFAHQLKWDNRCTSATWLHKFCFKCLSADKCFHRGDKRIPTAWYNAYTSGADITKIRIEKLLIPSNISKKIIKRQDGYRLERAIKNDWEGLKIADRDHNESYLWKNVVVAYAVNGKPVWYASSGDKKAAYTLEFDASKALYPYHTHDEVFLTLKSSSGENHNLPFWHINKFNAFWPAVQYGLQNNLGVTWYSVKNEAADDVAAMEERKKIFFDPEPALRATGIVSKEAMPYVKRMLSLCDKDLDKLSDIDIGDNMYAPLAWCGVHSGNDKFAMDVLEKWEVPSEYDVFWPGKTDTALAYILYNTSLGKPRVARMQEPNIALFKKVGAARKKELVRQSTYCSEQSYFNWLRPNRIISKENVTLGLKDCSMDEAQGVLNSFKVAQPLRMYSTQCARSMQCQQDNNWPISDDHGYGPSHVFKVEQQNGNGFLYVYEYIRPDYGMVYQKYSEPYVAPVLSKLKKGDYLEACNAQKAVVLVKDSILYRLHPIITAEGQSQEHILDLMSPDLHTKNCTIDKISEINKDDIIEVTYCNRNAEAKKKVRRVDLRNMKFIDDRNIVLRLLMPEMYTQIKAVSYAEHFKTIRTHMGMLAKFVFLGFFAKVYGMLPSWLRTKR
jgi:hypothetical protein